MSFFKSVIDSVGGVKAASKICGISPRAMYKWLDSDSLPRTDYTGETNYADLLAEASDGKFTADELREKLRPGSRAA
ncbi:MAG TPA: hypothetical protein DCQ09_12190 [Alcanivorax sp.]|nr:MAG: hypothetical protein COA41_20815 [Sphingopyxis sp.]HAM76368.1 hypothetical protein [Alcanivorax sp.]